MRAHCEQNRWIGLDVSINALMPRRRQTQSDRGRGAWPDNQVEAQLESEATKLVRQQGFAGVSGLTAL